MNIYWISWYQLTEDHRPLRFPPGKHILGWWCTGYRGSDNAATLVAAVAAQSKEQAEWMIDFDWAAPVGGKQIEWRFCEELDELKTSSRFPLNDWMEERYDADYINRLAS